jgi:mRNA-degrading endonuclease toxin of MazEF toxin-antitoxin module
MVVVSADVVNRSVGSVVVVPLTSKKEGQSARSHEVLITRTADNGLTDDSFAQPQYVTSIDRYAGIERICGRMSEPVMRQITSQLMLVLGHIPSPPPPRR